MNTVIRWNPVREMAAMQSAMNRLFEEAWRNVPANNATLSAINVDIHETDQGYTIITALPGLRAEDIQINVENGVLTISGEFPKPEVPEGTRVLLQENGYGRFSRTFNLPHEIEVEKVDAAYENGVLRLSLPKAPHAQPRQIPVGKSLASKN